jgi:formamidopyrimidine-DNA glycosylase
MPEGDSVWRAARRLDRGMAGHRLLRSDFRVPQHAEADLAGQEMGPTDTHGKHMLTRFDGDLTLHTHFRMDGSWTVLGPGKRLPRNLQPDIRVVLHGEHGRTAYGLLIPVVELIRTSDEARVVGHLGPDPLREDWDAGEAVRRLGTGPLRPIAAALLDQRLIAGLGNLWVNEICFLRGMSPWTPPARPTFPARSSWAGGRCAGASRCGATGRSPPATPAPVRSTGSTAGPGWRVGRCGTRIRHAPEVPGDSDRRATWWCPTCQPGPGPVR